MRKLYLFAIVSLCLGFVSYAQQNVFHRSDAGTGDWGSANLPWYYQGDNNNQGDPDSGNTTEHNVEIGHNNNTTMTTNGRWYRVRTLTFATSASSVRTINNSSGGIATYFGLYNASGATHVFNTPIGIDASTIQIYANSTGGFSFTDNIFINANTVEFGGSGTGNISHSTGTISGTGALTKSGSNTLTLSGTNSYSGATTVSGGTLVLNSSISSSAVTVESGATLQISSNATLSSLTVNDGGQVTVDAGVTLTVSGALTLNSGSSMVVADTGAVSGTGDFVTFNRNLANGTQWYLVSSPVSGETYNAAWATANSIPTSSLDTDNIGISTYDNSSADTDTDGGGSDTATGHWRYLQTNDSNSDTFNDGQGYGVIRSSGGDISFNGNGIYATDQTITLAQGVNNFNLVGNPFTGSLNLGDFFADNGGTVISGAQTWFWNGSSYDVRTSGGHASYEIAPGQGFFVEAADEVALTFDNTDVSHTASTFQRTTRPEITLTLSDGTKSSNAYVYYMDGTSKGYDIGYDGHLFGGVEHNLALYTHLVNDDQGEKFQLQILPKTDIDNMIVPVGIIADAGTITFSVEDFNLPAGYKVYLEDKDNGNFIRLDEDGTKHEVALSSSVNGIGRFFLHVTTNALSSGSVDLSNISAYLSDSRNLRVVGIMQGTTQVKLFNILGKQVFNTAIQSAGADDIPLPSLRQGVYILQITSEEGSINKKLVIE